MKRRVFLTNVCSFIAVFGCSSDGPTGNNNPPPPPPPSTPPPAADVVFKIEDDAFVDPAGNRNSDATVTINAGQTIRWDQTGSNVHTVTSTSEPSGASSFDSGNLSNGQYFTITLTTTGTYVFYCTLHPSTMKDSTIIVQ